jgi:hypothetical protein
LRNLRRVTSIFLASEISCWRVSSGIFAHLRQIHADRIVGPRLPVVHQCQQDVLFFGRLGLRIGGIAIPVLQFLVEVPLVERLVNLLEGQFLKRLLFVGSTSDVVFKVIEQCVEQD